MTQEEAPLRIVCTKPGGYVSELLRNEGVEIVADEEDENVELYVLSRRLVVERRTVESFTAGIIDKTLFTSALHLQEQFDLPVLVVEGDLLAGYRQIHPRAVLGALSAMVLQYGVHVVATADEEETAGLVAMMARHEHQGIPAISLVPKRKAVDLPDRQRRVVEMLPGGGHLLARRLLQHFGTIRRLVNADETDLLAVRGVGPKTAAEMVEVLTAEYAAVDTEHDLEEAIVADSSLLFPDPVDLLDRQHYLYSDAWGRRFVDLVFVRRPAREVVFVELKRTELEQEHEDQLRVYLDHARDSRQVARLLAQEYRLRGVLATCAEETDYTPASADIEAVFIDRDRVIEVLKRLREARWSS